MSKAFKCDICGEYKDGLPTIMSFKPREFADDILRLEICGACHIRMNDLFQVIAKEHNFVNDFKDVSIKAIIMGVRK